MKSAQHLPTAVPAQPAEPVGPVEAAGLQAQASPVQVLLAQALLAQAQGPAGLAATCLARTESESFAVAEPGKWAQPLKRLSKNCSRIFSWYWLVDFAHAEWCDAPDATRPNW